MNKLNVSILWEFIKIISPIGFGLLGFLYGWRKDREIKEIRRRASAPFFRFETFELDASLKNSHHYEHSWMNYNKVPSQLNSDLISIEEAYPCIPSNYPDNLVIGVELTNNGTEIRSFSVKNKNICSLSP